jgi:hypothetical protein
MGQSSPLWVTGGLAGVPDNGGIVGSVFLQYVCGMLEGNLPLVHLSASSGPCLDSELSA